MAVVGRGLTWGPRDPLDYQRDYQRGPRRDHRAWRKTAIGHPGPQCWRVAGLNRIAGGAGE